ncbi:hypothetical protein CWM47_36180 [Spirosoma pollinicola]|uniref:Uncharacterized protein n=1 Tax=Spirosoma pollinicola TaxID=2057025 RepID=A0A2K8ZAC1_9BACT|nr:hypothetical protein CWM47_36180 [Spirosoma pollinicola]
MSGCTVNRYYYIAEEPIQLYEFQSLKGAPLLTISIEDTVYATGVKQVGLGGSVPVEYKDYRFNSPLELATFDWRLFLGRFEAKLQFDHG